MTSAPARFSSRLSREVHHAIYGSGPSVHRTHRPATPLFRRATEFCTHYAPQEHDEDAEQNPFKLSGNVKPVEGRVVYVVFTPGNAITPSRNSSLVSQTQFVFGRKFNSDLGGSGAEH